MRPGPVPAILLGAGVWAMVHVLIPEFRRWRQINRAGRQLVSFQHQLDELDSVFLVEDQAELKWLFDAWPAERSGETTSPSRSREPLPWLAGE